jgi:DNA helicase-2/ATP-dependent DNA helicase PcrA
VALRAMQENADAAWIVSTHDSEPEARLQETQLSLIYGVPTLPFHARPSATSPNSVVGDQARIDRVFSGLQTERGGRDLLRDYGLSFDHPHHIPRGFEGRRRNVTVTLCGDRRGRTPMHAVAVGGRDPEVRSRLEDAGLSVRPAKAGSRSWRYESCFKDFGEAMATVERIQAATPATVRPVARLGARSLPFIPAQSVRRGMVMFTEDGGYDIVESVAEIPR